MPTYRYIQNIWGTAISLHVLAPSRLLPKDLLGGRLDSQGPQARRGVRRFPFALHSDVVSSAINDVQRRSLPQAWPGVLPCSPGAAWCPSHPFPFVLFFQGHYTCSVTGAPHFLPSLPRAWPGELPCSPGALDAQHFVFCVFNLVLRMDWQLYIGNSNYLTRVQAGMQAC